MRIACIVAEYNPLHLGHVYHIRETRKKTGADCVVAVMSGSFVQRGEPALVDKFSRASTALSAGIDLVLELPVVGSLQSAQGFARAAVGIADKLGADFLSFGAESDLSLLFAVADLSENDDTLHAVLQRHLKNGHSYPAAYAKALDEAAKKKNFAIPENFWRSNNLLALEYIRELRRARSLVLPVTVLRTGADYLEEKPAGSGFQSATTLRRLLLSERAAEAFAYVPPATKETLLDFRRRHGRYNEPNLYSKIVEYMIHIEKRSLQPVVNYEQGIDRLLAKSTEPSVPLTAAVRKSLSRRYKKSRLMRFLFNYLLGITADQVALLDETRFLRPLAFNDRGRLLLRQLNTRGIPVLTKFADRQHLDEASRTLLAFEERATDLYFHPLNGAKHVDYLTSPLYKPT